MKMSFKNSLPGGKKGQQNGAGKTGELISDFGNLYQLTSKVLGSGSYAEVKLAIHKSSGKQVAVKIIDKLQMKSKDLKKLYKEVEILKNLKHKNIVRFYDSFEEQRKLYIVMEYVTGGELFLKIVDEDHRYSEADVKSIVKTMALALKYCKDNGVIHRDIKPENILLTGGDSGPQEIKLADFNLSTQLHPTETDFSLMQTMCGTPNYVAPEVLSGMPYDYKCDVWSVGVICYLLLSGGYLPFYVAEEGDEGRRKLLQKVKTGQWDFTPEIAWAKVSDQAKDFLTHVMAKKPSERFGYEELLAHPWLNEKGFLQEEENVINCDELVKLNAKRKLLKSFTIDEAAKTFEDILKSKAVDDSSIGMLKDLMNKSFQASGEAGFSSLLDE